MEHIEYFKLQAKNLLKDYKTRFFNEESGLYEYKPKFFDIGKIFIDFGIPDDKENFSFTLMNAQHVIAKIVQHENWNTLINARKEEQRLAHRRLDLSKYKFNCALLVKEKSHALGFGEPVYRSAAYPGFDTERFDALEEIPLQPPFGFTAKNPKTGLYDFSVKIGTHFFVGSGVSLPQAKSVVDKKAYRFLCYEEQKAKFSDGQAEPPVEESEEWEIPHRYTGLAQFWSDEKKKEMDEEFKRAFPDWGRK